MRWLKVRGRRRVALVVLGCQALVVAGYLTFGDLGPVSAAQPAGGRRATVGIALRGESVSNVNASSHQVTVPSKVVAGDGLLLFFSANTKAEVTAPAGWRELGAVTTAGTTSHVWRRVAVAGDAGKTVRVEVGEVSKANLVLAAYAGTSRTDPVAAFDGVAETVKGAVHASPQVDVVSPKSWGVTYWSHKDSVSTELTPPAGVAVRAHGTQHGSGRITALLADSGGPVDANTYGDLTAMAGGTTLGAATWTVILAPR